MLSLELCPRAPSIADLGERLAVPAIVAADGASATERFYEFFAANIRNANTREAYYRAVIGFFTWTDARGLRTFGALRPMHVAAYVEDLARKSSPSSVKQALAAVRMLFDWLVTGQVVSMNPAHAVRGPKHIVSKGKTPVLTETEARHLLASIDVANVVGLRDRALIGAMLYTFARVEAAVQLNVEDYFVQGRRSWLRLQEKGGKQHEMPAHHKLEEFLDAYLDAAGVAAEKKQCLFRTAANRTSRLTPNRMTRKDVWRMVRRRAKGAGIQTLIGCHSFRATGITNYLENGGTLERAQKMAAHSSARTTKLYDRRDDQVTLDEIERIAI